MKFLFPVTRTPGVYAKPGDGAEEVTLGRRGVRLSEASEGLHEAGEILRRFRAAGYTDYVFLSGGPLEEGEEGE